MPCAGRGLLEMKKVAFATAELADEVRPPKIDAGRAVMHHQWQEAAADDPEPLLRPVAKAATIDDKHIVTNAHGHLQCVAVRCHFKRYCVVLGANAPVPCMAIMTRGWSGHPCSCTKEHTGTASIKSLALCVNQAHSMQRHCQT